MLLKSSYAICFALLISCGSPEAYKLKSTSRDIAVESGLGHIEVLNVSILHVDLRERVVTLKSQDPLMEDFYLTADNEYRTTAALKIQAVTENSLYLADILEGSPHIGDTLILAGAVQKKELSDRYTDAEVD